MSEDGVLRDRYRPIHALKACAIVDVVFNHGVCDPFRLDALPLSAYLTAFATPAFLFASGFQYHRNTPVGRHGVSQRASALLIPYFIASLFAFAYRVFVSGYTLTLKQALVELATGGAFNVYYFVPLLFLGLLATPFLSHVPRLVNGIFALSLVATFASSFGFDPIGRAFGLYFHLRSPFLWSSYFMAGWVTAKHQGAIAALSSTRRRVIGMAALAVLTVVCAVCTVPGVCGGVYFPTVLIADYAILTAIFMLSIDLPRSSLIELLSVTTYPIFLYHFFFTDFVRAHGSLFGPATKPLAFGLGWVGPVAVQRLALALLGPRARRLVW